MLDILDDTGPLRVHADLEVKGNKKRVEVKTKKRMKKKKKEKRHKEKEQEKKGNQVAKQTLTR